MDLVNTGNLIEIARPDIKRIFAYELDNIVSSNEKMYKIIYDPGTGVFKEGDGGYYQIKTTGN